MKQFIPLLIGHAILWVIFAREAVLQPGLTDYIKVQRVEARVQAEQMRQDQPERRREYGSDVVEWDSSIAATAFINSDIFRPLMIIQLLLFQTTNLLAPAYFAYVTHKLQYARSRAPIIAVFCFFLGAFLPSFSLVWASEAFYGVMHYAMLGLWYPLVVAVMIYSAQDRLGAQPERLGADHRRRRSVPRSTTRQ